MSREHAKVASKIPKSVVRCGPRRMLQHLCEKCGSGKPFTTKNGKTMTVPVGEYQVTDKELMKVFGTDRPKTIGDWRRAIVAATNGAVTVTKKYKNRMPWPVNVYQIDLKKLDELKGEIALHSRAESDLDSGAKIALETINSRAKTAALLGVPSERIVGTKAYDAFDGAVGGKVATPPTTQRSAALRIVGDDVDSLQDKTNPYEQGEIESIQQHMDDLEGYEGKTTPELAIRVRKALEAHDALDWPILFTEYLPKVVWLRNKTQGRLDWLVDRIESKGERSLLAQFKLFYAKRKPVEDYAAQVAEYVAELSWHPYVHEKAKGNCCDVCGLSRFVGNHQKSYEPPDKTYLEGEIDLSEKEFEPKSGEGPAPKPKLIPPSYPCECGETFPMMSRLQYHQEVHCKNKKKSVLVDV